MLGEKIRNFRKQKHMTIQEMAEATELSIGYISQIERNLVDPSLSSLRKISKVIGVPTYMLIESETKDNLTIRKDDVTIMKQPRSSIEYYFISPLPTDTFTPKSLIVKFKQKPKTKDGEVPIIHESEEIIVVEKGNLIIFAGEEEINLNEGDSTIIKSNVPHTIYNNSDFVAEGICILTPAVWRFPFNKPQDKNKTS